MSSSLATVKTGTLNTATLLKDSATNMKLKDRATIARTGLSTTFDSFKKKTEMYFKRES